MSAPKNDSDYQVSYRLTLLHVFFLPTGALTMTLLSMAASVYGIYYTMDVRQTGFWVTVLAVAIFFPSLAILLYSYRRLLRAPVFLHFTKMGVTGVGPYHLLRVERGLMKTSIIRSISGHFVVVPMKVLSKSQLQALINANLSASNYQKQGIDFFKLFRAGLLFLTIGFMLLLCLFAPIVVGKYAGYGFGLVTAIVATSAWTYLRLKLEMSSLNLLIWSVILLYLAGVLGYELLLFLKSLRA